MVRPKKLAKGDMVGVVAPAGWVKRQELDHGLAFLRHLGLKPVLGKQIHSRHRFLAGGDLERAEDLMDMFTNKEVKAIFCARGGYGCNRIIEYLQPRTLRQNPKIFVGASDVTTLLLYLSQKLSMVTFHGPMVAGNFGCHPMKKSKKQFWNLLTGKKDGNRLVTRKARVLKPGKGRGPVIGGCLSLLCRSLKTPWEIQTRDKILLIEDVNEAPYRVDGMLWQLKKAGKFKGVKGIVFGEMVNCQAPPREPWSLADIIQEMFDEYSFPVMMNMPLGHGKEMWTVPFGVEARMDTAGKSLVFSSGGVV